MMELPVKQDERGREKPDTQYCYCPTQQAILSACAIAPLTAESSCYSPAVPPAPSLFPPFSMREKNGEGGLKMNSGQAHAI